MSLRLQMQGKPRRLVGPQHDSVCYFHFYDSAVPGLPQPHMVPSFPFPSSPREEEIDGIDHSVVLVQRGVRRQTRATLLGALRSRDHSEGCDPRRIPQGRRHTPRNNAETQVKTTSGTGGGSRNSKTANRLSECALESHCRRRHGESVSHITGGKAKGVRREARCVTCTGTLVHELT